MKLTIGKIFTRFMNQFSSNSVKFFGKQRSLQSFYNTTNVVKSGTTKIPKPNLYVPGKKKKRESSKEKIGVYGYTLLGIPVASFLLGTWQVQRRKWKLNLIENLASRTTHEPIELPENLEELESLEYYPIKVKGKFMYENEFIIGPRNLIKDGKPANDNSSIISNKDNQKGYYVITPFKLSNQDLTILVNRGWIPKKLKNSTRRQEDQIEDEVEIVGILRLNETRPPFYPRSGTKDDLWYYRDVEGMAEKAGTSPIYIDMVHDKNFPEYPIGSQTSVHFRNEHFSYIITWYSLSVFTGYMWYKQIFQKVRVVY